MASFLFHFTEAGNAFCQAATIHLQLQVKHQAASSYVDAATSYKKSDPQSKWYIQPILITLQDQLKVTFLLNRAGPLEK